MIDRLTKEQAPESMERRAQERKRPPISQDQLRRELDRDLIDAERAERERRKNYC